MKTISFPVGYRPNYLTQFLDSLSVQNLSGYEIYCSAENCPECIEVLKNYPLKINIFYKKNSSGQKSHSGARENMFNVLHGVFNAGSDFNVHLEDDFLLAPDALDLANWYYDNYKDTPTKYTSYGLFSFSPRGDDYSAIEEVTFFEGLGWCTFKENWKACFEPNWFNDTLAMKFFNAYGWDWAVQAAFRVNGYKALRPLINRTQHNGRIGGTCCTIAHHDTHYVPLKWNQTEVVKEFKIAGGSDSTKEWIK